MEICQHCGMYMKPFKSKVDETHGEASCEFCGEVIATWEQGVGWKKVAPKEKETSPSEEQS